MTPSRRDIAPSLTDRTPIDRTTRSTPTVEGLLRHAIAIGAVLVVLLPAARGFSDTFGWMPLWLLAMPLSAWWALHRFRLPGFPCRVGAAAGRDGVVAPPSPRHAGASPRHAVVCGATSLPARPDRAA